MNTTYLVEVDGYNSGSSSVVTSYFCNGTGYISGSTTYLPRVQQPGLIKQSMFQPGRTGGASSVSYGDITLNNADGALDYLKDYGLDGRKIVVKTVDPVAGVCTVFTGTMEQPVYSLTGITLVLRDKQYLLRQALQPNKYAGTGGVEGSTDLKNRPKPLMWGDCYNVTPPCVNTATLTYQANDGYMEPTFVYDNGVALTAGADYATSALLQAATVTAGTFASCMAEGFIRLGSSPAGQVTVTGTGEAVYVAADIIQAVALKVLTADEISAQGIIDVRTAQPGNIGIFIDEESTPAAVLDELCDSIGAWYGFDAFGIFNVRMMAAPGTNPILQLTKSKTLTLERVQTNDQGRGVPVYKYTLHYRKNYTIQKTLAASSGRFPFTSIEYRTAAPAVDSAMLTKHLLAQEMEANTLLTSTTVAATEATRRLALYGERDRYKVTEKLTALEYPATGWWDDAAISELLTQVANCATVIYNGYLYVIGGTTGATPTARVSRLNLSNPTVGWDDAGVTDLPATRWGHCAVVYGTYLYVFGGFVTGAASASVIRLNLSAPSGAWDDAGVTDLPATRTSFAAVVSGTYVYLFGGDVSGTASASTIRLNLSSPSGAWDDAGVTNLPAARTTMACALYGGYVYLFGGYNGSAIIGTVIRLNLASPTGAWDDAGVTDLPAIRSAAAAVMVGSTVWIIGGGNGSSYLNSTIRLDLATPAGAWDTVGVVNLPENRTGLRAEYDNGHVFIIGGYKTGSTAGRTTMMYRSNSNPFDRAHLYEVGQDITLTYPRYGMTGGKNFKIIGTEVNYATNRLTMDLWG